jgi:hypothetical protein
VEFNPSLVVATVSSVMIIDCWLRGTSTTIAKMPARSARGILSRPFMSLSQSVSRYQIRHPSIPSNIKPRPDRRRSQTSCLLSNCATRHSMVTRVTCLKSPCERGAEIAFDKASQKLPVRCRRGGIRNEAAESSPKREYLVGGHPENRSTQFERRFRNLSCRVSHAR